jgi:hypothetical protein
LLGFSGRNVKSLFSFAHFLFALRGFLTIRNSFASSHGEASSILNGTRATFGGHERKKTVAEAILKLGLLRKGDGSLGLPVLARETRIDFIIRGSKCIISILEEQFYKLFLEI